MIKIIFISYLLGSIPTAYILTKLFKGVDIRKVGSGNPGTTNVIRTAGIFLGVITFIIDFLKGLLPVLISKKYFGESLIPIVMLAAVFGHIYSVFLLFRGGKGVATFFGALLGLSTKLFFVCLIIFCILLLLTHIVSISSIITVTIFALICLFLYPSHYRYSVIFFIITSVIIILRHKSNIQRLLQRKEQTLF